MSDIEALDSTMELPQRQYSIRERAGFVGRTAAMEALLVATTVLGGIMVEYGEHLVQKGIGAGVAALGLSGVVAVPVIYFQGDADISPHRSSSFTN